MYTTVKPKKNKKTRRSGIANPALGAAGQAHEPRTRAAPPTPAASRRCGGGGRGPPPVPVGVTGNRTQRPRGASWTPRSAPSPAQLPYGPRGRTVASMSPLDPHDRAAGRVRGSGSGRSAWEVEVEVGSGRGAALACAGMRWQCVAMRGNARECAGMLNRIKSNPLRRRYAHTC
jgi:hypothetical protein